MSGMEELYKSINCHLEADFIRAQIKKYIESFPTQELDQRATLFADDVVFTDPANAPSIIGLKDLYRFWEGLKAAPFDMRPEQHQLVVCGDSALLDFTMHMVAESGTQSLRVRDIIDFNEAGKIKSITAFWDPACMS